MTCLVVQAVSGESKFVDIVFHLELLVSVSYSETGLPVCGLLPQHFRLCSPAGKLFDTTLTSAKEASWNQHSGEGTGCYLLALSIAKDGGKLEWLEGEFYPFGIQVRFRDHDQAMHVGQSVVRIQSLGK